MLALIENAVAPSGAENALFGVEELQLKAKTALFGGLHFKGPLAVELRFLVYFLLTVIFRVREV